MAFFVAMILLFAEIIVVFSGMERLACFSPLKWCMYCAVKAMAAYLLKLRLILGITSLTL